MKTAVKLALFLMLLVTSIVHADVPLVISYQGKLMTSSGTLASNGNYTIKFSVYDQMINGSVLWQESNTSVTVKDGLFAVMLGSITSIPADLFLQSPRYLGIKVGSDSELAPRQKIASVPYAIKSGSADLAQTVPNNSITTDKIADGAITASKLGGASLVPAGVIVMWSGKMADIPTGWALCDGTNNTPDLKDRFVVGAGGGLAVGATGGAASINLAHSHTVNDHTHNANHSHGMDAAGNHDHSVNLTTQPSGNRTDYYRYSPDGYSEVTDEHQHQVTGNTGGAGNHTHGIQGNNFNTGGATDRGMNSQLSASQDIRPPYFALAYIIKLP